MGMQSHRGGDVRFLGGPAGVKSSIAQGNDPTQWEWKDIISIAWTRTGEHINVLEARAYGLALRWRARALRHHGSRFVHLVDSLVVLGVMSKGRSSSTRLRPVIMRNAAVILAAGFYPSLGYVRTHVNPADRPSRRVKRHHLQHQQPRAAAPSAARVRG